MGQNWDVLTDKLTGTVGFDPVKVTPRRIAAKKLPDDRKRLAEEVAQRIEEQAEPAKDEQPLSKVEQAMMRNAPDLAGAPEEVVLEAETRRFAYTEAKWPRPRLVALIVVGTVGVIHPMDMVRLGVWGIIIFLVASVAVGPERARDGANWLWRRVLQFWKVELFLGSKLVKSLRAQLQVWFRTAQ